MGCEKTCACCQQGEKKQVTNYKDIIFELQEKTELEKEVLCEC
jgi:hypothetical protein